MRAVGLDLPAGRPQHEVLNLEGAGLVQHVCGGGVHGAKLLGAAARDVTTVKTTGETGDAAVGPASPGVESQISGAACA